MARVILNQNQSYVSDADDIITQIGNLSDVFITSTANGQIIIYNDSLSRWENTPLFVVDADIDTAYTTLPYLGVSTVGGPPEIFLSNTEEAGTECGKFTFWAQNDNYVINTAVKYAEISGTVADNTESAHDGRLEFKLSDGGSLDVKLDIQTNQIRAYTPSLNFENPNNTAFFYLTNGNPSIALNDNLGAITFTDSNYFEYGEIAHTLVDNTASLETSRVYISNSRNGANKLSLMIDGQYDETQLTTEFVGQYHDSSTGPIFVLVNSTDPGVSGDISGSIYFAGHNDAGAYQNYGLIETNIDNATDGAEESSMLFRVNAAGTFTTVLELSGTEISTNAVPLVINDKIRVNASGFDDFTVVRSGSGLYAVNIASDIAAALANGNESSYIGFEIQTTTDVAYPGLIGSEYNPSGTNNGNKIKLQVYDDGVTTFAQHTVFEAALDRVVAYRPFKLAGYASTALPSGAQGGDQIAISDAGYKPAYFDGSVWRYVYDNSTV